MKKTKQSLLISATSLLLCVSMLIGTTYAWFTDSVTSGINRIVSGNLDVEMEWYTPDGQWLPVNEDTKVFDENALWEPGHTQIAYLRISNQGTLALKYQLGVNIASESGSVNQKGENFKLSDFIHFGTIEGENEQYDNRQKALEKLNESKLISEGYLKPGTLAVGADYDYVTMVLYMPETVGNEANHATGAEIPTIRLGIQLVATQAVAEIDSFGSDYDANAAFPAFQNSSIVIDLDGKVQNGKLTEDVSVSNDAGTLRAAIFAGTKIQSDVTKLKLLVSEMEYSGSNVTLQENESLRALDVHIEGLADDNAIPAEITLKEGMKVGLNIGNYSLYHVENGSTVSMIPLAEGDEPVHNGFTYDPATGNVVLYMASFSEVTMVAEPAKWNGNYDYSWYTENRTSYTIANADQLAGFSAIVGGMDGRTADNFSGKTVTMVADINIGDVIDENGIVFYPVGYYNTDGTYERTGKAITSGFRPFEGTFDGAGHKISNLYQNTWEMKGDHNWYDASLQYYRDGMGIFGRVYGGTIKNLTVHNFSSDGEITTTGVIASYADHGATFENIAITSCNPRVYNIGNGGIVGVVGWYNKAVTDTPVTFRNITVDNTNKISALWGSWDVPCGGIVGTYYPTSGQSSAGYPANAGIRLEYCHVGAQIDVNNDVCANYQYYAYRYAGMLIGNVDENVIIDGHEYPKMDGITASNCTVHFGTWNDYYYCELVDNSTASYTHDYQMSRLTEVKAINGSTVTYLDGTTGTIPSSGRANYVIVDYTKGHGTENAECYHYLNGNVWKHEDGGKETVNGVEVLKEDKQHIYLEFNNLVTGNGWGVTSKYVGDMEGVTILDRTTADSVDKFQGKENLYPLSGRVYKLSHIFNLLDVLVPVHPSALTISVDNLDDKSNVTAQFVRDNVNWGDSTLVFSGSGNVRITIQDYYYCNPESMEVTVIEIPEGSVLHNFTYDGFEDNGGYEFDEAGDRIYNGKHGVYEYNMGFGSETMDYAYKMDSKGKISFTPKEDGTITVALSSTNVGAAMQCQASGRSGTKTEITKIYETNKLMLVHMEVSAGTTYTFTRAANAKEFAIYYISFLPASAADAFHICSYYKTTTATCTTAGQIDSKCIVCKKREAGYPQNKAAEGHTIVYDEAVPATCTSAGKEAGSHCAYCDEIDGYETINKIPHDYRNGICLNCGDIGDTSNLKVTHKMDFTTGQSSGYSELGYYFTPYGICSIDNSAKYMIMKNGTEGEPYIEFTITSPSTVIIQAASTDRNNTSRFKLVDANGNAVAELNGRTSVTGATATTLIYSVNQAGTYRLVCNETERVGRLLTMKVADGIAFN